MRNEAARLLTKRTLKSPKPPRCRPRTESGELPYCVKACPNKALAYGADALPKIEAARERGARIYQLPAGGHSKDGVIYASPDRMIL